MKANIFSNILDISSSDEKITFAKKSMYFPIVANLDAIYICLWVPSAVT